MEQGEEPGVNFVTLYARIVNELAKNPRVAQEKLAVTLNVTMRTVQRHLTQLEREGFLRVQRDRKPYIYEVVWNRRLRHFEQLTVGTFRPDVLDDLARRNRSV